MVDLILEFGCESCYLHDIDCGTNCIRELKINLSLLFNHKLPSNFFSQNINDIFTVKKDFFYRKRMPDVWRYDLKYCEDKGQWLLYEPNTDDIANQWVRRTTNDYCQYENPIQNDEAANNILIILESPHDDEYHYPDAKNPYFMPLQPANGATGINFSNYFTKYKNGRDTNISKCILTHTVKKMADSLESKLTQGQIYHICIINPVPFQASLHFYHRQSLKTGEITGDIRDIVWKELFKHCENDFIRRIGFYKPFAILNACTGGRDGLKDSDSLKFKVDSAINKVSFVNNIHKFNTAHPSYWHVERNRYCDKSQ